MTLFALLSVLVFSFALELDRLAREEAVSGVLWVTLIFASLLGLEPQPGAGARPGQSGRAAGWRRSRARRSYVGKLLGNVIFTALVAIVLLPLLTMLYGMNLLDGWLILTTGVGIYRLLPRSGLCWRP